MPTELEPHETAAAQQSIQVRTSAPAVVLPIALRAMGGKTSKINAREMQQLPKELPLQFLKNITDGFSREQIIGQGEFGVVYKGTLESGEVIAVKKLRECPVDQERQFRNEVANLMAVKHENIVNLICYCYEKQDRVVERHGEIISIDVAEKLLCYEYLTNGSLDTHLFDGPCKLGWHGRLKIIKGICRGLQFLHEGSRKHVIHLDLKPSNILLDCNMVPKIADFGLSRLLGLDNSRMYTNNVIGTIGYIAPEYKQMGEISVQADIFSLGILIIEITTGEKNRSNGEDEVSAKHYIDQVRGNWADETYIAYKYSSLDSDGLRQVKTCMQIALKCVEIDRNKRPSIGDIVARLDGDGGSQM